MSNSLLIYIWDVGHGISIYLQMPSGHHHMIDLGKTNDFSPSQHLSRNYCIKQIDNLIISHPDQDHLGDIPDFVENFGYPRVLTRNTSLPNNIKYGSGEFDYQNIYKKLDNHHIYNCDWRIDPQNPKYNGGVEYLTIANNYIENETMGNDTSLVVFISYFQFLLICPGDIEPLGWDKLYEKNHESINNVVNSSRRRILVAPHHGRKSGYSDNMINTIKPCAVIISDVWGDSETHSNYYNKPKGIYFDNGTTVKYYTTKRGGRIRIEVARDHTDIDQFS